MIVMWIIIVSLTTALWAEEADYFPLQVGNRWVYQCINYVPTEAGEFIPDSYTWICDDSTQQAPVELMVADTMRLDIASLSEPTWFSEDELPFSPSGTLYYRLYGEITSTLFVDIHHVFERRRIDAILVRNGKDADHVSLRALPGISEISELGVEDVTWVGGILVEGRWLVYDLGRPLWLWTAPLAASQFWLFAFGPKEPVFSIEEPLGYPSDEWGIWELCDCPTDNLRLRQIEVPAGIFPESRVVVIGSPEYDIYFAPGVGVVQIGRSGFQLVEASVNGTQYPLDSSTPVQPAAWGHLKLKEAEK